MLSEKGRGKRVKCLKIYSFSELFPNPKQGTMMHAWWRQPKGNKNKFKIFSPDPTRPYKGIKLWLWMNEDCIFFSLPYKAFNQHKQPTSKKMAFRKRQAFLLSLRVAWVGEGNVSASWLSRLISVGFHRGQEARMLPSKSHRRATASQDCWE